MLLAVVAILFLIWLQTRKGVRVRLSAETAFGMMLLQPRRPEPPMGFTAKPFATE